jgi:hypothetical protein
MNPSGIIEALERAHEIGKWPGQNSDQLPGDRAGVESVRLALTIKQSPES